MMKLTVVTVLALAIIGSTALSDDPTPALPDRAREIIGKLDTDRDGTVTRDEFGGREEVFDRLDRDGDGALNLGDMPRTR